MSIYGQRAQVPGAIIIDGACLSMCYTRSFSWHTALVVFFN